MSYNLPKTPRHRARSEAKTPLTPSLVSGLQAISLVPPSSSSTAFLSPTKPQQQQQRNSGPRTISKSKSTNGPFDTTNPFLGSAVRPSRSRPASPTKRATAGGIAVSDSLQRQAGEGIIRKGGIESKLDVITRDYVPPPAAPAPPPPRQEIRRSRSTPATNRVGLDQRDRFITNRDDTSDVAPTLDLKHLNPQSASPGHTARLAEATGVPINRRILGYHEQPPAASTDTALAQHREYARPLYAARPAALPSSTGATTNKTRKIATTPERVLDAPGMMDDFYLNLISWSCLNMVAVALEDKAYVWNADTGTVAPLGEAPGTYFSSVDFSNDGLLLGAGNGNGDVDLWDVETGQKLRSMTGHQGQVATLSWHEHLLSSGCGDGSIWHHDVRVANHKVMELLGHTGEVCGLTWRADGELIASGGNDNVVNIWDGRVGDVREGARGVAKWVKRDHTAAVKAIAWCPWQTNFLATGGGTNDATINVWNSTTGARLHTIKTPSQVTSLIWAPAKKEIFSTHGYPTNSLMVHSYPKMETVAEIRDAHDQRVLFSAVGPGGDVVVTSAGDECLKFWRIWDGGEKKKKKEVKEVRQNSTSSGILSLR